MLLIVSNRDDLHVDWLILELERRGAPFIRFNTEDYPAQVRLVWTESALSTYLEFETQRVDLADVSAVWYRRPVPSLPAPGQSVEAARWAAIESREALLGAWRTLDALWVNHPDANRAAESKPRQLRVASRLGFDVPRTLVSNDASVVTEFVRSNAATICKPLYDGRIPTTSGERIFFTSVLRGDETFEHLGPEPYLFQSLVPKSYDVRATVIGEDVFACRIESQSAPETTTDWRRGDPRDLIHRPEMLPDYIAQQCVRLTHELGLTFGAIDLARQPDGGYSFFEINPNGQWAWVEQRTGIPIAARMADLLLGAGFRP